MHAVLQVDSRRFIALNWQFWWGDRILGRWTTHFDAMSPWVVWKVECIPLHLPKKPGLQRFFSILDICEGPSVPGKGASIRHGKCWVSTVMLDDERLKLRLLIGGVADQSVGEIKECPIQYQVPSLSLAPWISVLAGFLCENTGILNDFHPCRWHHNQACCGLNGRHWRTTWPACGCFKEWFWAFLNLF